MEGRLTPNERAERRERKALFLSGALAGLVMAGFSLLLRHVTNTDSLIELIGEVTIQTLPLAIFSLLLETLQQAAKPLLVVAIVAGIALAGGGVAHLDGGAARQTRDRWLVFRMLSVAVAVWLPLTIAAIVAVAWGTNAPVSNQSLAALSLILAADVAVFVLATYLLYPLFATAMTGESTRVDSPEIDAPPDSLGRRRLLSAAATGAVTVATGVYVGRFANGIRGGSIGGGSDALTEPITPVGSFYTISKNFVDPNVDPGGWSLRLTGLVETPRELTYADVTALPSQEQQTTLTCISNEVGGDLISNARWTGARLSDVLALAGVNPLATELALYADDGYTESFPLSKALEPTTMLVWLMNGAPLTATHGSPARLIVPGLYGIKNVKWLTRIDLVASDFKGYWQQRGWTDDGTIQTMSRFDIPAARAIVPPGPVELAGIAFAGDRGVSRVEISDDGETWQEATDLTHVAPLSWTIWRFTWNPRRSGTQTLRVRAMDGRGDVQTSRRRDPIPDGATGYHTIDIGVT